MFKRSDYLHLIEKIKNTERESLDDYIEKVFQQFRAENINFLETQYKDIHYLLKDLDKPRKMI